MLGKEFGSTGTRIWSPQSLLIVEEAAKAQPKPLFDAFVSYASEDRHFVAALVDALRHVGYRIWFDQTELRVGDSLTQSLDRAVAESKYAIVVLSDAYLEKRWTRYELKGLLQREVDEGKFILPVWFNIDSGKVKAFSAMLADKIALQVPPLTLSEVAQRLAPVIAAIRGPA